MNLFLSVVWESSPVWFFACSCPVSQHRSETLFPVVHPCLHCHQFVAHTSVSFFLGSLFHWSVHLFLCQYMLSVLITATLGDSLKSGSVMLPLSFFLRLFWLFQMCFHTNFRLIYSSSVKNAFGILIGIALTL